MKPLYKTICSLFFLLTFNFVSTAQYVTLQGKQFKDENGANFYPMVTEYVFTVIHNVNPTTAATDYLLARSSSYGPCTDYLNCYNESSTEANLLQEIKNDFDVIHQMGFNTIRTAGIGPEFEYAVLPSSGFTLIGATPAETDFMQGAVLNNITNWAGQPMKISTNPADNDPYRAQLFHFIDEILEAAYDKQLKVMLDVGYGKVTNNITNGSAFDHFTAYKNYLTLLAEHIVALPDNLKKTLVAYVIVEEPTTEGEGQDGNTKQSVCDKTNQMYDLLKSIDPNHLITIGSFNLTDLTEWDPGVMKLDFWSPHFYVYPYTDFELDADAAVNRVKNQIYWLKDNCPMPWIIGETSFAAIDDQWYGSADRHYPEVNGELDGSLNGEYFNQKNYAQEMLAYVRDCGGSGFSWWEFQELSWGNPTDDGYGLLRHGEAITDYSAIRKPVVDVFENYLDVNGEPPAPNPANAILPPNYYDPNNFDAITPNSLYRYTGTISDQTTGLPIKDALIYGWSEYTTQVIPTLKFGNDFFYTYSQPDGSYVINLEHPNVDYTNDAGNSGNVGFFRANNLQITTSGAEREEYGWMGTGMPANLQIDVALKRNNFSFVALVDNQTLANGTTTNLVGWNSLTVSGTTTAQVGSSSTFTARNEVQVSGEFHAETGSEVHIYNSETFQDCPDFTDFLKINPNVVATTDSYTDELTNTKMIEVNFTAKKPPVNLSVQPNPNKGLFTLELNSVTNTVETNEPSPFKEVKIRSVMGNLIYYSTFSGNKTQIDLTAFGKGVYVVQVKTNHQLFNQKMIIQ